MKEEARVLLLAARAKLDAARMLSRGGAHGDAASRAYYAVFHAMSALLLSRGDSYSRHGELIGAFNRLFVRPGLLPAEFSAIVRRLFEDRQTGDYDPTADLGREEAERDIEDASRIIDAMERLLEAESGPP